MCILCNCCSLKYNRKGKDFLYSVLLTDFYEYNWRLNEDGIEALLNS